MHDACMGSLMCLHTWKPTYTLARLMVGLHHSVNRRLGIWFSPDRCALVSFLYLRPPRGTACQRLPDPSLTTSNMTTLRVYL